MLRLVEIFILVHLCVDGPLTVYIKVSIINNEQY